jgi:hypothetical protein
MSKYIVTVFDNDKAAYEGARALLQLEQAGKLAAETLS